MSSYKTSIKTQNDDLDDLLNKWNLCKKDIVKLEKQCDKYKKSVEKRMDDKGIHILKSQNYKTSRRLTIRESITKKILPTEIWKKYCTKSEYYTYTLTKLEVYIKTGSSVN